MHDEHRESLNSEIWVFDWEGQPLRKILPNTRIECFCVDKSDATFYCIMNTPERSIGMIPTSGN